MKAQIDPPIKAHILRSALIIRFGGVTLALAALASASNLTEESTSSHASLRRSAATHETRVGSQAGLQRVIEFPSANEVTPRIETVSSAPPTRSSFMATWGTVSGAKGYFLDVSTSNSFSSYVDGYQGLNVGNVNGRAVTGLNSGTTYYYRVHADTGAGSGGYSNVMTATTNAPAGLIINPTFDSSIPPGPIQAMIMRAIGIYESLLAIRSRSRFFSATRLLLRTAMIYRQAFSHRAFSSLTTYSGTILSAR